MKKQEVKVEESHQLYLKYRLVHLKCIQLTQMAINLYMRSSEIWISSSVFSILFSFANRPLTIGAHVDFPMNWYVKSSCIHHMHFKTPEIFSSGQRSMLQNIFVWNKIQGREVTCTVILWTSVQKGMRSSQLHQIYSIVASSKWAVEPNFPLQKT